MSLPTATTAATAPRLCMREGGARISVHSLSLPRTERVTCGFSNFEVWIGPVTVTGWAASSLPQPWVGERGRGGERQRGEQGETGAHGRLRRWRMLIPILAEPAPQGITIATLAAACVSDGMRIDFAHNVEASHAQGPDGQE